MPVGRESATPPAFPHNQVINPTTERAWTRYLEPKTGAALDHGTISSGASSDVSSHRYYFLVLKTFTLQIIYAFFLCLSITLYNGK
jgi:hypothetical protein